MSLWLIVIRSLHLAAAAVKQYPIGQAPEIKLKLSRLSLRSSRFTP
jgi:hypothetical protein